MNHVVGQYVRMVLAPNARMGTITKLRTRNGRTEYLFHHDSRFDDVLPDVWQMESELEACERPTDAQVAAINALAKRGA